MHILFPFFHHTLIQIYIQLTLVISNSMGPWKKLESTVVRLKRSYENTGSVVCLTTKGRQLERNFEELKPASHVPILGTICFSLLNSLNLVERLVTSRYLFCVYDYVYPFCLCFSAVALSLNFTHHDVFFFVQYCLFTINCVFL
jgi:hypothetical protein